MSVYQSRTWAEGRDLWLERRIDASPEWLFKAWTQPELLKQWFAPSPWSVPEAQSDLRVGGSSRIVMRGPDGTEFPNVGVYLEVVANRRLVFTDAFVDAWTPSERPFMTVALDFITEGDGALYRVRVLHWSVADREKHEEMGFHHGWPICAEQLAALVEG
jgi:uncharacterized protein YndB with AHSA1/START domain